MGNAGGKGSGKRPLSVPKEVFDNNFDAIFGKKESKAVKETSNTGCDKYSTCENGHVCSNNLDWCVGYFSSMTTEPLDKPVTSILGKSTLPDGNLVTIDSLKRRVAELENYIEDIRNAPTVAYQNRKNGSICGDNKINKAELSIELIVRPS